MSVGGITYEVVILVVADDAMDSDGRMSAFPVAYCEEIAKTHGGSTLQQYDYSTQTDNVVPQPDFGALKAGTLRTDSGEEIPFTLLLKDTKKLVRQRKVYSHALAFTYLLQHGCDKNGSLVLLLDGDTSFNARPVEILVQRLQEERGLAAVCVRIKPIPQRGNPLNGAQEATYAIAHYLDKITEKILGGTVLCCPGP